MWEINNSDKNENEQQLNNLGKRIVTIPMYNNPDQNDFNVYISYDALDHDKK